MEGRGEGARKEGKGDTTRLQRTETHTIKQKAGHGTHEEGQGSRLARSAQVQQTHTNHAQARQRADGGAVREETGDG